MSDFVFKGSRPESLGPFAKRVFDVLAKYTAFPWPIMLAQCRRANVDPPALSPLQLAEVVEFMAEAVGRFTSPAKATAVRSELQALAKEHPSDDSKSQ